NLIMDSNQTTASPILTLPVSTGIFGTKIPSAVAFAVGILLFLLPFSEIKCGSTTLANKSGLDIALGNEWKTVGTGMFDKNDFQKNINNSLANEAIDKTKENTDSFGFDKIGESLNNIKLTLNFTPWFYITVIAFLVAAFFCYMRMRSKPS